MRIHKTLVTSIILTGLIYLSIRHIQRDKRLSQLSALYDKYRPMSTSEKGFSSRAISSMAGTLKRAAQSYISSNNMSPASNKEGTLHE